MIPSRTSSRAHAVDFALRVAAVPAEAEQRIPRARQMRRCWNISGGKFRIRNSPAASAMASKQRFRAAAVISARSASISARRRAASSPAICLREHFKRAINRGALVIQSLQRHSAVSARGSRRFVARDQAEGAIVNRARRVARGGRQKALRFERENFLGDPSALGSQARRGAHAPTWRAVLQLRLFWPMDSSWGLIRTARFSTTGSLLKILYSAARLGGLPPFACNTAADAGALGWRTIWR